MKLHQCLAISFLLSCVCLAELLPEHLKQLATCRKEEGNFSFTLQENSRADLYIQSKASPDSLARITVSPGNIAVESSTDGKKFTRKDITRRYQAPASSGKQQDFILKFRDNEWSFFIDDALVGIMPALFSLPGTISIPDNQSGAIQGATKFLPVPKTAFVTNFMIEEGAQNDLYPWEIKTGKWHLHTALQQALVRPETHQENTQKKPLTADKSPNFYSLKGGGNSQDAIITTGADFYDNYSLTCSIQLDKGEAGLVFYHRDEKVPLKEDGAPERTPDPEKADFYAMTLLMNVPDDGIHEVRLWHQKNGKRHILARAEVPLYANQWALPGVAVHGDEIICYLDHDELFRVTEPLTVGGKFGMFANTPEEIRLDDVTVKHFADIRLDTVAGVQFNLLHTKGSVSQGWRSITHANGQKKPEICLKDDAILALGRTQSKNRVFETTVTPAGKTWTVGLAAAWRAPDRPALHFAVSRKEDGTETYTLSGQMLLGSFSRTLPPDERHETSFSLMMDATEKGKLRCIKNGRLIFIQDIGHDLIGANAIWTQKGTKATFTDLSLNTERDAFKEQEQKNPIYKEDSFMRHWASPEGQWIAGKANAMWHKGDFFNDFVIKLPCIQDSNLSVAVPDDQDQGPVTVSIEKNTLTLTVQEPTDPQPVIQATTLTPPPDQGISSLDYELHHEGYWLWIDIQGKTVLKHQLANPLRHVGTRARVQGLSIENLARSKVTRTNVIDEFFNESPHDWIANGGDWQIINRFQCTPSWSHMIGEAPESLAAFWRKQIFKGDMTLEFYAGTRQGYYNVAGNLNCTILANDTTASSGYTVACTEFDHNHSQNWTTLYKDGIPLERTDAYLVPRQSKHTERRIRNPLIAQGRPIHGAWFYIKLRKIGDKIEYYFDDELVFSRKDPQALQEGLVGIWTFLHSMTLAQIKITFDSVRPRPIPVTMLDPQEDPRRPQKPTFHWKSTLNAFSVDPLDRSNWTFANNTVSQSTLTPFQNEDGASALLYKNALGGGDASIRINGNATLTDLKDLAGWRIKIKRTHRARFNLLYEIGAIGKTGAYTTQRRLFQHISGDTFNQGATWKMTGHTDVPPASAVTTEDNDWTTVDVWIPSVLHQDATSDRIVVKLLGFGLEQTDALMNGIAGNGPGESYAVGDITPIFFEPPLLQPEANATWRVIRQADNRQVDAATPEELKEKLLSSSTTGLNTATLQLSRDGHTLTKTIAWIHLPHEPIMTLSWNPGQKDTITLTQTSGYPDPRFANAFITLDKQTITPKHDASSCLEAISAHILPTEQLKAAVHDNAITVRYGTAHGPQTSCSLPLEHPLRNNAGPALAALDGFSPLVSCFELALPKNLTTSNAHELAQPSDANQGQSLHIQNKGLKQRLKALFKTDFSLAQYPLIQFKYNASEMANITLQADTSPETYVRLAKDDSASLSQNNTIPVRLSTPFAMDQQWHTWTGFVSDACIQTRLSPTCFFLSALQFGSISDVDQTGLYADWSLDDLVIGPAVQHASQLTFTPHYEDIDGVQSIFYALLPGNTPYSNLTGQQQNSLSWVKTQPEQPITPDLTGCQDGLYHILLKAQDTTGCQSGVLDMPFLLDTTPMEASYSFEKKTQHDNNLNDDPLTILLNTHQASPWAIHEAKITINGKSTPAPKLLSWSNRFSHGKTPQDPDKLVLNLPLLFRKLLNHAKDGDTLTLTMENLKDGAGNTTPPLTIPYNVNYATDKTGPSWYYTVFGPSYLIASNWDGKAADTIGMKATDGNVTVAQHTQESPHIVFGTIRGNGAITYETSWSPTRYPYLSFRMEIPTVRKNSLFSVILATQDGRQFPISLTAPSTDKNELNTYQTFTWNPGDGWHHFTFDIPKMLANIGLNQEEINSIVITSIQFNMKKVPKKDSIKLDDLFVYGLPPHPQEPDCIFPTAFDASGVAKLEATYVDKDMTDQWTYIFDNPEKADLNLLRAKITGTAWFRFVARDNAGNASQPFWLPLR